MRSLRRFLTPVLAALAVTALSLAGTARAEPKPQTIRIAYPGVGVGNRPFAFGNTTALMHLKGMLEEEFKKDGITVAWSFLRGAGPATNELYANGLVDFSLLGDLPSIAGRASGIKTRVLAATGIRGNTYIAVPADSNIQSIKDLKGKKVAIFKGTNMQLSANKILEAHGLTEKDIRALNMDSATSSAALITKDVDAVISDLRVIAQRDQGVARIIYTTEGDPRFLRHASFVGTEEFIKKYPSIAQRVVTTLVKAAKWASDQERAPTVVYQLWAKSGVRYNDFKEDQRGQSIKVLSSPLLDAYFVAQYTQQVEQAKRFKLIRNSFSVNDWLEPRFLQQALKDLKLEGYWQPADQSGKIAAPSDANLTSVKPPAPPAGP
jgi:sulfonate transport system substrate-binding protein